MQKLKFLLPLLLIGIQTFLWGNFTYTYRADITSGIIGVNEQFPIDDPFDNIFHIQLDQVPSAQDKIWLTYELNGVQDYTAIPHSINDQQSNGGYLVQVQTGNWLPQKEQINPNSLRKGDNVIQFSLPKNGNFSYQIRHLKLIVEKSPLMGVPPNEKKIVINQPSLNYYEGKAYISGFLLGPKAEQATVCIGEESIEVINGNFDCIIENPSSAIGDWQIELKAQFPDGEEIQQSVQFTNNLPVNYTFPILQKGITTHKFIEKATQGNLQLHGLKLKVPKNVLLKNTTFSATALRENDLPPISSDFLNVTNHAAGYRLLPHGVHFKKAAEIEISYDPNLIPRGLTPEHIKIYYYENLSRTWKELPTDSILIGDGIIRSQTTHFTDFISGIIQKPESPVTGVSNHESMTGIKAGNPSIGIPELEIPSANSQGTANINFPIKLPQGKNGMQPNVNPFYSNSGGSGWMGLGWNLATPSITIETQWGVPRFLADLESETYLLNGVQLAPVAHRAAFETRTSEKVFHPRIEGAFQKIIRHGNSPKNYWWEVIDKDGTTSLYGGINGKVDSTAILKDANSNIAHWALTEVRDLNGNFIRYHCEVVEDKGIEGGTVNGYQLYLDKITYTGFGTTEGNYSIEFIRSRELGESGRKDVSIDCRLGFKRVTADLLKTIQVKFKEELIRSYELVYKEGAFHKTLLETIIEKDKNGEEFYRQDFEYYDEVKKGAAYHPYQKEEVIMPDDKLKGDIFLPYVNKSVTAIGGNKSSFWSAGGAITFGPRIDCGSKNFSAGINYSQSRSKSEGLIALIDIDGNGLADKVIQKGGALFYYPNISNPQSGEIRFGGIKPIIGIGHFSKSKSTSHSKGIEANLPGSHIGFTKSKSTTTTTIYFLDFNNDGLIDIVSNNKVYFNIINQMGQPEFTLDYTKTDNPIVLGAALDDNIINVEALEREQDELIDKFPLHDVVRVWIAPFDGSISIKGAANLVFDNSAEATEYTKKDGVRLTIQHKDQELWINKIEANDYAEHQPNNVSNISVEKGDRIYFRVQSIFDGTYDKVYWNPEIEYTNISDEEINANNEQINTYKASDDFTLSSPQFVTIPYHKAKVLITGKFKKPITSDDITLELYKLDNTGTIIFSKEYEWQDSIEEDIEIVANLGFMEQIGFRIRCVSNIDWSSIFFRPKFSFIEATDSLDNPIPVLDEVNNPVTTIYPSVEYTMFNNIIQKTIPFKLDSQGVLEVKPIIDLKLISEYNNIDINGNLTVSIKGINKLYSKTTIPLTNASFDNTFIPPLTAQLDSNELIFVELYVTNNTLLDTIASSVEATLDSVHFHIIPGIFSNYRAEDKLLGIGYRHWGQFVWNGNRDLTSQPINEKDLVIEEELKNPPNREDIERMQNEDDLEGIPDPTSAKLVLMSANSEYQSWQGYDNATWVKADSISSSRFGLDDVLPNFTLKSEDSSCVSVPDKVSKSSSKTFAGGVGIPTGLFSINGSHSRSTTKTMTVIDLIDLSGDGYYEIIGEQKVQYTLPTGGLDNQVIAFDSIHVSAGESDGISRGGSYQNARTDNCGAASRGSNNEAGNQQAVSQQGSENGKEAQASANASLGLSLNASFNFNKDFTYYTLLDINADGLPDKIYQNGEVALNLGYSFLPKEYWGFKEIRAGKSKDKSGGLGVNLFNLSISAGYGLSFSDNEVLMALQDINGDGLLDILKKGSPLMIHLNTGNGFGEEIEWLEVTSFDKGSSTNESQNIAGTYCQHIPLPFFLLKICGNLQGSRGNSVNRQNVQIQDIDGDGFPDILASDEEVKMTTYLSTIGKTNLLKTIIHPLGASTTLDYKRAGNTQQLPHNKWVLASVAVNDGLPGDGADKMLTKFDYEDGKYDRREREFYGFATVKSHQIDTEISDSTIYRTNIVTFDTSSYYRKGLVLSQVLQDAAGNKYTETQNKYQLKDLAGNFLPDNYKDDAGVAFPALVETKELYYEGQTTVGLEKRITYEYDKIGNIISYSDFGNNTPQDLLTADITYHDIEASYIKAIPAIILVYTGAIRKLERRRETDIDERGNVIQMRQFLEDGRAAIYDMKFADNGNLIRIDRPKNHKGERLFYEYAYDEEVQTYVTAIKDGYGYYSSNEYDFLFGQLIKSVDLNKQEIHYELDAKGRVKRITGPYELGNKPYTFEFDYFPNAPTPYATTKHYDPEHDADLLTYTFMDGLGRAVQIKRTGVVYENEKYQDVLNVSGRVKFDAFGRAIEAYYPIKEALGRENKLNPSFNNTVDPTISTYDILDRNLSITLPDASISFMEYSIDVPMSSFHTKVTDALGNIKESFSDIRGRTIATADHYEDNKIIWTKFDYNPLSELLKVTDDGGNETHHTYDWFGRPTSRNHPDAGLTEIFYDLVDNVIKKIDANMRLQFDEGVGILYEYDHERLTNIYYPKNYQNNVQYTYGKMGDSFNRAGRIRLQEDASGGQEFFYGRLGEIEKTIRTLVVDKSRVITFVSEAKYDTWNRLQTLIYPDGEVVNYDYNRAGKLFSVHSKKQGHTDWLIKETGYDEFEQKVYCKHGNDTETTYQYEPTRRRLEQMEVMTPAGRKIMDNVYTFDRMNNISSIQNNAQKSALKLGGYSRHEYTYDKLYRLIDAKGEFEGYNRKESYNLSMEYDNLHNIEHKTLNHLRNEEVVETTSYSNDYFYRQNQPHAVQSVGERIYSFDANGNQTGWTNGQTGQTFYWDEDNRLSAVFANGVMSQYTYDANGERAIKSQGGIQGLFINGHPEGFISHTDNFTAYVSPYFVAKENSFTKHYYAGGQRIVSKLGTGNFYQPLLATHNIITAGDKDYLKRAEILREAAEAFCKEQRANEPPRQPTITPPPCGFDTFITAGEYNRAPHGWPQEPIAINPNDPPSQPTINPGMDITNDSVRAGFNYEGIAYIREVNQYFYHPDHLGSTSYITDIHGEIRQHLEYIPFGETFVEEYTSSDTQPYLFNGKELDRETGLYYYGARYLDPMTSVWLSVDPLADKYPSISAYAYTANNPIKFIDTDGREIAVQAHEVALGFYHLSIRITPENQDKYKDDDRFKDNKDEDGKRYATIGAGASTKSTLFGRLLSGVNRGRDVDLNVEKVEYRRLELQGKDEDLLIKSLLESQNNFELNSKKEPLAYDIFPFFQNEYNSNSFISGILAALGLPVPKVEKKVPGYKKRVPKKHFQPLPEGQPKPKIDTGSGPKGRRKIPVGRGYLSEQ